MTIRIVSHQTLRKYYIAKEAVRLTKFNVFLSIFYGTKECRMYPVTYGLCYV